MDVLAITFLAFCALIVVLLFVERTVIAMCDLIFELCESSAFLRRNLLWNQEKEQAYLQDIINRRMQHQFEQLVESQDFQQKAADDRSMDVIIDAVRTGKNTKYLRYYYLKA